MLPEIFQTIEENIFSYLNQKKVKLRNTKILSDSAWKSKHLRIELLRFGFQPNLKNFPIGTPSDKSVYAFTFFILADIPDYTDRLHFTEIISEHFDQKPFLQIKIGEQEFEVGISLFEVSFEDLNQFWMAQNQPHQPVLFYQARISEL